MNKLVYISATWCGPCKTFGPTMEKVAGTGIPVRKVDADQNKEVLSKYQIRSVPAVIKTDSSGKMLDKFVGVRSMQEVVDFYNG